MLGHSGAHEAHCAASGLVHTTEPRQPAKRIIGGWLWWGVSRAREAVLKFRRVVWTLGFVIGGEGADKALRVGVGDKRKMLHVLPNADWDSGWTWVRQIRARISSRPMTSMPRFRAF